MPCACRTSFCTLRFADMEQSRLFRVVNAVNFSVFFVYFPPPLCTIFKEIKPRELLQKEALLTVFNL